MLLILQMFTDSLIAFKTGLLSSFGVFFVFFMAMLFKDGRPYWVQAEVRAYSNCMYSFGSPDSRQFIATFVWPYYFMQLRLKYATSTKRSTGSKCLNGTIVGFIGFFLVLNYINGVFNGVSYLYQTLFGNFYGFCYLIMCMVFDQEVHRYAEKTGFILKSSRGKKFYLFFFALGLLLMATFYYCSEVASWNIPQ